MIFENSTLANIAQAKLFFFFKMNNIKIINYKNFRKFEISKYWSWNTFKFIIIYLKEDGFVDVFDRDSFGKWWSDWGDFV